MLTTQPQHVNFWRPRVDIKSFETLPKRAMTLFVDWLKCVNYPSKWRWASMTAHQKNTQYIPDELAQDLSWLHKHIDYLGSVGSNESLVTQLMTSDKERSFMQCLDSFQIWNKTGNLFLELKLIRWSEVQRHLDSSTPLNMISCVYSALCFINDTFLCQGLSSYCIRKRKVRAISEGYYLVKRAFWAKCYHRELAPQLRGQVSSPPQSITCHLKTVFAYPRYKWVP